MQNKLDYYIEHPIVDNYSLFVFFNLACRNVALKRMINGVPVCIVVPGTQVVEDACTCFWGTLVRHAAKHEAHPWLVAQITVEHWSEVPCKPNKEGIIDKF